MLDARFRRRVDALTAPAGRVLARLGVKADQLTAAGCIFAIASGAVVATGNLRWGAVLLFAAALPDLLDGPVARAGGVGGGPWGSFFDSVADRVSDSAVLAGLAWYLAGGVAPRRALLAVAVLALSLLVSYQRAKAESLGVSAKGGLMERGERIVVLLVALAVPAAIVPILWLMVALTGLTVAQRFLRVRAALLGASDGARRATAPPGEPVGDGLADGRAEGLSEDDRQSEDAVGDATVAMAVTSERLGDAARPPSQLSERRPGGAAVGRTGFGGGRAAPGERETVLLAWREWSEERRRRRARQVQSRWREWRERRLRPAAEGRRTGASRPEGWGSVRWWSAGERRANGDSSRTTGATASAGRAMSGRSRPGGPGRRSGSS